MSLRVVFLWNSMRQIGGVATFLQHCVRHLPAHGVDARIVELDPGNGGTGYLPGETFGHIDSTRIGNWQTPVGHHQSVVRTIANCRPHVVVTNNQWGMQYLPTFATHVPIVDVMHIDHPDPAPWDMVRRKAARLQAVVGVSDRIVERLRRLGSEDKVRSIPYGVATSYRERRTPQVTQPVILFVGRLMQRHKRARDLVPFAQRLSRELPDYRLIIIGDGAERAGLTEAIGRDSRIELTGAMPPDAVPGYLDQAHYFVQFSEFEGLSISLLEAMGRGVVPVVTAIGSGVKQVVEDGHNGFLFPVGQPEEAARLISDSLTQWRDLSRRAFRTIDEGFSLRLMAERYAKLFRELASEPLTETPAYVDEGYTGLKSWIARRFVPTALYRRLGGIV